MNFQLMVRVQHCMWALTSLGPCPLQDPRLPHQRGTWSPPGAPHRGWRVADQLAGAEC
jgi:hypothetical protein